MLTLDDVVPIDSCINAGEVLQCTGYRFDDGRHVRQRIAFALLEAVLLCFAPLHQIRDVGLEEARYVRSYLYRLYHTVSDDTADRIHRDHAVFGTYGYSGSCDLRTCSRCWSRSCSALYTWSRSGCSLLLLDVADDVGLADATTKARTLDLIQLFLTYLSGLSTLEDDW